MIRRASFGTPIRYASLCDGIGAAHVAWEPLGWQCLWTSEIEAFPAAVVEHHWGLPNLGDMTKITKEMISEHVDLLVGGTPCQSFSVAGLRRGLADPRGNLALRFVQLAAVMQPRWILWENVPGVLSSNKGRDFGTFLRALEELGYGWAYRTLDAQWFGVAQRRRRVFVVGYLGDWRRAAAVLFEPGSVFGNPPTRGAIQQEAAARPQGIAADGSVQPYFLDRAAFNQARNARHETQMSDDGLSSSSVAHGPGAVAFTKARRAQSDTDYETWVPGEISPTMTSFDQGDKRATTVVALQDCNFPDKTQNGKGWKVDGTSYTLTATGAQGVMEPLAANGGMKNSDQVAWAIDGRNQSLGEDVHHTLRVGRDSGDAVVVGSSEVAGTLTASRGTGFRSNGTPIEGVAILRRGPRRLTPLECERLQGFPDHYTAITYRGKPAADAPRYKALGNSMAVPVMRWIGERIARVDAMDNLSGPNSGPAR